MSKKTLNYINKKRHILVNIDKQMSTVMPIVDRRNVLQRLRHIFAIMSHLSI